jgi:hypothetical protein
MSGESARSSGTRAAATATANPQTDVVRCSKPVYMSSPNPISIRPEPGQPERIKVLAASTRRKQTDLIRWALELGLRQLEAEEGQKQRAEV